MGAVTAAAIGAAGALGGAAMQNRGARSAASAQQAAAQMGIDEQRRQFDTFQGNIQPYLGIGQQGASRLAALAGGDFSGFYESPEYSFLQDQGRQQMDRSAAANGNLFSGGHNADLMRFGQGLASQEYGNHWNRLMGLTSMGQNAAVGAGSMGQQSANSISNLMGNMGNAQAGGAINSANSWSNALAGLSNVAGQYMGSRQSSYQQASPGGFGAFTPQGGLGGSNNSLITGQFAGLNGWRG